MKKTFLSLAGLLAIGSIFAQEKPNPSLYGTGNWDADSLGNHRVVDLLINLVMLFWQHWTGVVATLIRKGKTLS